MNRVKELREAMGWNQTELGKKLNVKAAAISKYEKGDVSLTDETLKSLASIFEVSTDYILCLTDDPIPVRNLDQDLRDEHNYTEELEALMADEPLRTEFQDYKDWPEEDKMYLLNFLQGRRAMREKNQGK